MGVLSFLAGSGKRILGEKGKNGVGKRAKDNESGIAAFYYGYNGSIGGNSHSFDIKEEDGKLIFTYKAMENPEFGEMKTECGKEILSQLYALYKEMRIAEWNRFDKYNSKVLDGSGFSLRIKFCDNEELDASGSNAFPERYGEFTDEMYDILAPLREKVLEEKRQEFIAKGINGKLKSVMIHFKQQGNSGSDDYDFFLISEKYRENNCDIKYKSVSEDYLPKGEGSYHINLPLAEANLTELQKAIEEYNIISWYNYYKSAEDYNNCEWFQISFGFDDELRINAHGTEHPKNYDEFRDACIRWMKEIIARKCKD